MVQLQKNKIRLIGLNNKYYKISDIAASVKKSIKIKNNPEILKLANQYLIISKSLDGYIRALDIVSLCINDAQKNKYNYNVFEQIKANISKTIEALKGQKKTIEENNDICVIVTVADAIDKSKNEEVVKIKKRLDKLILNLEDIYNDLNKGKKEEGRLINIHIPIMYCLEYKRDKDASVGTSLAAASAVLEDFDPTKPIRTLIEKLTG